jgi:hypothetical protein
MSRRFVLAVSAVAVLVASWVAVLAMPAPRVCRSIDCGADFNKDALPRPFAFLNWQQGLAFVLGLGIFTVLMTMSVKRPADAPCERAKRQHMSRT